MSRYDNSLQIHKKNSFFFADGKNNDMQNPFLTKYNKI